MRQRLLQALEQADWKIQGRGGAAELLGINPSTLRDRMRKLGIQRSETANRSEKWTVPMLKRLAARRMAGESAKDLAAEVGSSSVALRKAWVRVLGQSISQKAELKNKSSRHRDWKVYVWRRDLDLTFEEIADLLGEEPGPATTRRLMRGLHRLCEEYSVLYPRTDRGAKPKRFREDDGLDLERRAAFHRASHDSSR